MKNRPLISLSIIVLCLIGISAVWLFWGGKIAKLSPQASSAAQYIALPNVNDKSSPLLSLLQQRRSIRTFNKKPLTLKDITLLLWAGQGQTTIRGFRTAPSAGALYPLTLYVIAKNVNQLKPGVYQYISNRHYLKAIKHGDFNSIIAKATFNQTWLEDAPAIIVITATKSKTAKKYAHYATKYVNMEAGAVAENIYLQAAANKLGTTLVGAIGDSKQICMTLSLSKEEAPLAVMPVGNIN